MRNNNDEHFLAGLGAPLDVETCLCRVHKPVNTTQCPPTSDFFQQNSKSGIHGVAKFCATSDSLEGVSIRRPLVPFACTFLYCFMQASLLSFLPCTTPPIGPHGASISSSATQLCAVNIEKT